MIKKISTLFNIIILTTLISACGSKSNDVPYESYRGLKNLNTALNYLLKGSNVAAMNSYDRAVDIFIRTNDFCNAAKAGIFLYTAEPINQNLHFLTDAKDYSNLGKCSNELLITKLLTNINDNKTINVKDYISLDQPFLSFAEAYHNKSIEPIKVLINQEYTSNRLKSVLYRKLAEYYININNAKSLTLANLMIDSALKIDQANSWLKNMLYDEKLKLKLMQIKKTDTTTQIKKIEILSEKINVVEDINE